MSEREPYFDIFPDKAGEWRWTLHAANGEPVGDSGEGYASKSNCERAVRMVKRIAVNAEVRYREVS